MIIPLLTSTIRRCLLALLYVSIVPWQKATALPGSHTTLPLCIAQSEVDQQDRVLTVHMHVSETTNTTLGARLTKHTDLCKYFSRLSSEPKGSATTQNNKHTCLLTGKYFLEKHPGTVILLYKNESTSKGILIHTGQGGRNTGTCMLTGKDIQLRGAICKVITENSPKACQAEKAVSKKKKSKKSVCYVVDKTGLYGEALAKINPKKISVQYVGKKDKQETDKK